MVNKQQGLIKLVILLIIAILVLSYLRIDLRSVVESEMAQRNLGYVWSFLKGLWTNLQAYLTSLR